MGVPSPFVRKCLSDIEFLDNRRVVDIPCGFGRHSILAIEFGCSVVAIDRDESRVNYLREVSRAKGTSEKLDCLVGDAEQMFDLNLGSFEVAIVADFVSTLLISQLITRMEPHGYLIFETFAGRGGNWQQLPRAGEIRACVAENVNLLEYRETAVKPGIDRVSVKCFAQKTLLL